MNRVFVVSLCIVCISSVVWADTFSSGANQFTIDFVAISGATNPSPTDNYGIGVVNEDYRIGIYEISNEQWNKFTNINGTPTGDPATAYDESQHWTAYYLPANNVSWYEAAQFVNWLNTSSGHPAAYKFSGTEGESDYRFEVWEQGDAGYNPSNPYRNSRAFYFLPTQSEWVKAGYWNGTTLQTYSLPNGMAPAAGITTNYDTAIGEPWAVYRGSREINGTYNMMGNVKELMESPYYAFTTYLPDEGRTVRGGSYDSLSDVHYGPVELKYNCHHATTMPYTEYVTLGFRVASVVPEPGSLVMISLGGVVLVRRRK